MEFQAPVERGEIDKTGNQPLNDFGYMHETGFNSAVGVCNSVNFVLFALGSFNLKSYKVPHSRHQNQPGPRYFIVAHILIIQFYKLCFSFTIVSIFQVGRL